MKLATFFYRLEQLIDTAKKINKYSHHYSPWTFLAVNLLRKKVGHRLIQTYFMDRVGNYLVSIPQKRLMKSECLLLNTFKDNKTFYPVSQYLSGSLYYFYILS